MKKTGEIFWKDENGDLFLIESFVDKNGEVTTEITKLD